MGPGGNTWVFQPHGTLILSCFNVGRTLMDMSLDHALDVFHGPCGLVAGGSIFQADHHISLGLNSFVCKVRGPTLFTTGARWAQDMPHSQKLKGLTSYTRLD